MYVGVCCVYATISQSFGISKEKQFHNMTDPYVEERGGFTPSNILTIILVNQLDVCKDNFKKLPSTYILQICRKFVKPVFLVPRRTTLGGIMMNGFFSLPARSGFFALMMLNTLSRSYPILESSEMHEYK